MLRSEPVTARPRFGAAARPHLRWLYSLARRLVGDPDTAEDLVQRCLSEAHRTYDDLDDVETLRAWLRRILVDCGRDDLRARGPRPEERSLHGLEAHRHRTATVEDPPPYSGGPHLDLLSSFEIDDLDAVLGQLETIYRVPLVLVHMEGYTTAEVADLVDASPNTVLSRLHRARERFERRLVDHAKERGLLVDMRPNISRVQPPT